MIFEYQYHVFTYYRYFGKWHLDGDEKPGWGNRKDRKFGFIETKFRYNRGHWKFFDRVKGKVIGYEWKDKDKFKGRHEKHYATDFLFDRGMEFIDRQVAHDRQFAMVMSIPDPHGEFSNIRLKRCRAFEFFTHAFKFFFKSSKYCQNAIQ